MVVYFTKLLCNTEKLWPRCQTLVKKPQTPVKKPQLTHGAKLVRRPRPLQVSRPINSDCKDGTIELPLLTQCFA